MAAWTPELVTTLRVMTPTIMELDDHNRISRIIVGWPAESIMAERLHQQLAEKWSLSGYLRSEKKWKRKEREYSYL
jgi:hypothetical protein